MYKAVFLHRKSKDSIKKGLDRVPAILVGNGLLFDVMFFFSIFSFLHLIWLHLHVIVVNLP